MKSIYKYQFKILDPFELVLPCGAEILCIKEQGGEIFLWAQVDTEDENEERRFRVFGTGHEIEQRFYGYYVTTLFCGNSLVWHVYEEEK